MWIAADAPNWADQLSAWGQLSGAVATFAAVAFAYWLARRDLRWRREERAVALAEQADRDAAQARLVKGDVKRIDPESDSQVARIIVRNGSTAPVFDVDVTDVRNDVMLDRTWEVVLDQSSAEDDGPLPVWMAVQPVLDRPRVLPAGATFSFTICYMHRATLQPAILYGEDHITSSTPTQSACGGAGWTTRRPPAWWTARPSRWSSRDGFACGSHGRGTEQDSCSPARDSARTRVYGGLTKAPQVH